MKGDDVMSTKHEIKSFKDSFADYDRTSIVEYLEEKALDGWCLVNKPFSGVWDFKRIEPQPLHYAITYLPQFSNEDDFLLSENKKEYLELCAEQGWQFACAYKDMVIFYNEEENPLPLQTDPEVELALLHKSALKRVLPNCVLSAVLFVSIILCLLFLDTVPTGLFLLFSILLMVSFFGILEFFRYLRWHKKALAAAAVGEFSRTDTKDRIISALLITFSIATFAIIVVNLFMTKNWESIGLLAIFSVYILCNIFLDKFKKELKKEWEKRAIGFVSILLYVALVACIYFLNEML